MRLVPGPGALVAAAFIGPGTVTACTLAGAGFGYTLIWALVFATVSTIILQEMAARLGIAGNMGLATALVHTSNGPVIKWTAILLGVSALAVGNAAYEAGNLAGGALGAEAVLGLAPGARVAVIGGLAGLAATFLWFGRYRHLEALLVVLVIAMALAFAGSVVITRPDIGSLFQGLVPTIPDGGLLTAVALIGTTIVPYNLFLHASAAKAKWSGDPQNGLRHARYDTSLSIGLGGLISILIVSTAAASLFGKGVAVTSAGDMALAIEPAYGPLARYMVGLGLLAAGLSSAITAPLATAYAMSEFAGAKQDGPVHKSVALAVLGIGTLVAVSGLKPVSVILFAQVANGLLLPVIATFLLLTMNRKEILGDHTNSLRANMLGGLVVLITFGLGLRLVLRALDIWP